MRAHGSGLTTADSGYTPFDSSFALGLRQVADRGKSAQMEKLVGMVLVDAARRATTRLAGRPRDTVGTADWSRLCAAAARLVHSSLRGGDATDANFIAAPRARDVVGALRASLLDEISETGVVIDTAALTRVLQAFERVEGMIQRHGDRSLPAALAGSDGVNVVVELAHDMRSPLTSILFLVETLRQKCNLPTATRDKQLSIIYGAAFGLGALVSDIVDMAQNGDRLMERAAVNFSVGETMRGVQEIVQPIAEAKQLVVDVTYPLDGGRLGHPLALSRVLLNLTTNALKFTTKGTVSMHAERRGGDRFAFSVTDTGPGIEPDVIGSLFQPVKERGSCGGSGGCISSTRLGLAMCDTLIRTMGGELAVHSELGKGTRFSFEIDLPRVCDRVDERQVLREAPERSD